MDAYRAVQAAKQVVPGYPELAPDLIPIAEYLLAEGASMVRRKHEQSGVQRYADMIRYGLSTPLPAMTDDGLLHDLPPRGVEYDETTVSWPQSPFGGVESEYDKP